MGDASASGAGRRRSPIRGASASLARGSHLFGPGFPHAIAFDASDVPGGSKNLAVLFDLPVCASLLAGGSFAGSRNRYPDGVALQLVTRKKQRPDSGLGWRPVARHRHDVSFDDLLRLGAGGATASAHAGGGGAGVQVRVRRNASGAVVGVLLFRTRVVGQGPVPVDVRRIDFRDARGLSARTVGAPQLEEPWTGRRGIEPG